MASGSSDRSNSGSKGFDFGTDDILCSYEDYGNKDSTNGSHSDPVIVSNSTKDYHKSRMSRSSLFHASSYSQPEDSFSQDVISVVERSMKKHTDGLMRFLEGVSSRLSQLELNCYNLDKSIGEMRSDLVRHRADGDSKLKSLEKHLQEVHRSVQILRDKQELADTQKELAKLQLVQKEPSSSSHSQAEEKASPPATDPKKTDNTPEIHSQQLALALPHQIVPQPQSAPVPPPSQAPPQNVTQQQSYYLPPAQLPNPPAQAQHPQGPYMSADPQYGTPQIQDMTRVAPQPAQTQINQTPPGPQFTQYQHQWPQQLPQQVQAPQQPPMQPQMRPSSPAVYPTYPPQGQPTNSSPPETMSSSMPMQLSYAAVPQPLSSGTDAIPYGYGAGRTVPQQPQAQQVKAAYGAPPGDGYATGGPHSALPPGSAYMMYDSEGGRAHHPPQQPHFSQGGYPPTNLSLQNPQSAPGTNMMARNPSHANFVRNHPYSELIDKLVSMGFRAEHIVGVIQRMEESGQPLDFNAVLDRLSNSSGGSQRGWSG
ncbi:trithorax group protein osa isoform X2 [Ricinus communis]|uniref:Structural constituent of cell wall, putative n=1 Tax=Ricinus communis TaxID=3988 RepID=B9RVZ9_RICCO|nr:trithorax group protein osa isoform X2 [Ricinus communis]EEF44436.1 structural constituent of cell wall, putative [Ricinus communis]|eukprot:XP_002517918.1 trithorax group protein osa isoform X2 [Ricinus communis]